MICSPARKIANQQNAKKSTGPKTPEGKARSRCNAIKHGLTGQGIALPDEDVAEIARRFDGLHAQFHPATPMGSILVHRVAFMSVRLERCAEQEAGHLGEKIRHAKEDYDEQRQADVAKLLDEIGDNPATAVRRLLRTPEGIEALVSAWLDLKSDLERNSHQFWTNAHCAKANHLVGRRMEEIPISRINELTNAIRGDFGLLRPSDGEGLADEARQAWARQELLDLIDDEVAALRHCFERLDHDAFEQDREEAPKRALFDSSKPAILARRYEFASERSMYRALRELQQVEKAAAEDPQAPQAYQDGSLASFGAAETEPPEEVAEPETEPETDQVDDFVSRSASLIPAPRGEFREETTGPGDREEASHRHPSRN